MSGITVGQVAAKLNELNKLEEELRKFKNYEPVEGMMPESEYKHRHANWVVRVKEKEQKIQNLKDEVIV